MAIPDLKPVSTSCLGGINQAEESASLQECADARNVWAPNGKVVQRPGYVGIAAPFYHSTSALTTVQIVQENPIGTFSDTVAFTIGPNGRWYALFSTAVSTSAYAGGFSITVPALNSDAARAQVEYYNGTEWRWLAATEITDVNENGVFATLTLGAVTSTWLFPWPNDMAQVTVNGHTGYGLRFTILSATGLTAFTTVGAMTYLIPSTEKVGFINRVKFAATNRVIGLFFTPTTATLFNQGQLQGRVSTSEIVSTSTPCNVVLSPKEPPTYAVVPDTNEAFLSYANTVFYATTTPTSNGPDTLAQVETNDFAVGTDAPYDKSFIAQRSSFPNAKYILYNQGRLWYTTDTTVGWSAAVPYHKVFPLLSEEPIADAQDNSAITGLAALGEQTVVFKQNSIWVMVLVQSPEENPFGLSVFKPIKRVSGVGCVSNASIKAIQGRLIFLGHDGLYAFDGTSISKISLIKGKDGQMIERLQDFWASVTPGQRQNAIAADYKPQSHYLLSISVDGSSTNNRVLAWHYASNTFWIWDSIEARGWIEQFDVYGDEHLYFYDTLGRIFEFGKSETDNGSAISSYVLTEPIGLYAPYRGKARELKVTTSNMANTITVDVFPDDNNVAAYNGEASIDVTHPNEKTWAELVWNTDNWTDDRKIKRKVRFNIVGEYFQAKVSHSSKNTPFSLVSIDINYASLGRR